MNDFKKLRSVILRQMSSRLFSARMAIMLPILILFIPGMAWGFSDPDVMLPGGVIPSSATEVMFYTSLGIVFGVLEFKLSQPMPRSHQSIALVMGHWLAILIPIWILWSISFVIVNYRMGDWPSIVDGITSFISVALILLWYVLFSLIASSQAKDQ